MIVKSTVAHYTSSTNRFHARTIILWPKVFQFKLAVVSIVNPYRCNIAMKWLSAIFCWMCRMRCETGSTHIWEMQSKAIEEGRKKKIRKKNIKSMLRTMFLNCICKWENIQCVSIPKLFVVRMKFHFIPSLSYRINISDFHQCNFSQDKVWKWTMTFSLGTEYRSTDEVEAKPWYKCSYFNIFWSQYSMWLCYGIMIANHTEFEIFWKAEYTKYTESNRQKTDKR